MATTKKRQRHNDGEKYWTSWGEIRWEGRGGEALWTAPTQREEIAEEVEKDRLCFIDRHEGKTDKKGGRTQREEGHKGREDMKGGRTWREGGHEGREDTKGGRTWREEIPISVAAQLYSWRHENYSELWGECPMNSGVVSRNLRRLSPLW
jgi:hypothetical protein